MIRALWFLFIVALGVFALNWLVDRPGSVVLNWQGYRVETSVAVLISAVVAIACAAALILQRKPSVVFTTRRYDPDRSGAC